MQKKIPCRKCSGCGESKPKKELIRIVRAPDSSISLDFVGKKPGRGAYICPDLKCLLKAKKAKRIERGLDCEITEDIYAKLEEKLKSEE